MLNFLNSSGFQHLVATFFGWAVAFVVVWVVCRFFLVRKDTLAQSQVLFGKIIELSGALAAQCGTENGPELDSAVASLRQIKKKLLRADKLLSIYQYEHNDVMALVSLRGNVTQMVKRCEACVCALSDGNFKAAADLMGKLEKTCQDEIPEIVEIAKIQQRKKMLEV